MIDKNGKLKAVAIYLQEDGVSREVELDYQPNVARNIGENYVLLDGNFWRETKWQSHKIMLVNKNTGRIYEVPRDSTASRPDNGSYANGQEISANSVLIWRTEPTVEDVKQITFSGDNGSCKTIGHHGFFSQYSNVTDEHIVKQLPNGTVLSQSFSAVGFLFPNGGYDYLQDIMYPKMAFGMTLNNGCSALSYDAETNMVQWYDVIVGTRPEDTVVKLVAETAGAYPNEHLGFFETNEHVIGYGYIFDKATKQLQNLPNPPKFTIAPFKYYAGRLWDVAVANAARGVEALWFDPISLESGSLDLNLNGVDVESITPYYAEGKIVIYGTRRSDSSAVVATLSLATYETDIVLTPFQQNTTQLIPLN